MFLFKVFDMFSFRWYLQIWCTTLCFLQTFYIILHKPIFLVHWPTGVLFVIFDDLIVLARAWCLIMPFKNELNAWWKSLFAGRKRLVTCTRFLTWIPLFLVNFKIIRKHIFKFSWVHNMLVLRLGQRIFHIFIFIKNDGFKFACNTGCF